MPSQGESDTRLDAHHDLIESSISLIASLQDPSGAYPASPTFSAYKGYCWLRDGAFIADGMSRAGQRESASRFFDWCALAVGGQAEAIRAAVRVREQGDIPANADMPPTRFTLAGSNGTDGWWDFQTDGYGTWLWALSEHVRRGEPMQDGWLPAVRLTVDFLLATWDMPCYDWWEENETERHVSTLGCVAVGLERAVQHGWLESPTEQRAIETVAAIRELVLAEGMHQGRLSKWLTSTELDASLLALVTMGYLDDEPEIARATVAAVRDTLVAEQGVHRYLRDVFYGGGLWPLLTCFLGLAELRLGSRDLAWQRFEFSASTANADAAMPEQVADHLLAPEFRQEWLDRWGPVATPLLWSHAMHIRLAAELALA